ncbi:MAG: class II glutamine amidotransferase [Clostridiales bacterium]|nr:class II glutamine amidotransferase [Clostridiales bacterium]
MCELFGVSASVPIPVNGLLKEFFSHSTEHPNGWGMATFHGNAASVEKEPTPAFRSSYLKARLAHPLETEGMIAHIRLATVGSTDYENCHPFVQRDRFHRCWTLAHNGTMFHCPALGPYQYVQEGRTDSERILCCLIDRLNQAVDEVGRELIAEERFRFLDRFVCEIIPGNKMNFLLYDGELLYVHTNYANSLYVAQLPNGALFATTPLGRYRWTPAPFTTLCAYKAGRLVYTGTNHGNEYIDNEADTHFLFLDFAAL